MKKALLRFILYATIIYLTGDALNPAVAVTHPLGRNGTHFCGVTADHFQRGRDSKHPLSNRHYARSFAANLNVGEPRTVRMIYFLPNDRPYQAEVVQRMKDEIRTVQNFFAEQMESHGYGRLTFGVETDPQGEPVVHRVDGRHPDSRYLDNTFIIHDQLREAFNYEANIYLIVIDISTDGIGGLAGQGVRHEKQGYAWVTGRLGWEVVGHELGHAFGLLHDFRDGAYIMSYGPGPTERLSQCHAEYLSVHPYFNSDIPIEGEQPPTVELISPHIYPAGSKNIPIQLRISDSDGLHQVILYYYFESATLAASVKACRELGGQQQAVIEFNYDGVIPFAQDPSYSVSTSLLNPLRHPILVEVVDTDGNVGRTSFELRVEAHQLLAKISGDNQQGVPNTPLLLPFVVELLNVEASSIAPRAITPAGGVPITFTVTAGGGTLSVERVRTDYGRAESTLTLGPNFGTNTVEVSAEGLTVTFNAVAVDPVDIPDTNLRAAIEEALDKAPGTPIASADMAALTRLEAVNANISDLTGLEGATNLTHLDLGPEYVEAKNRWVNSNSVSDLSPLRGLTKLMALFLGDSNISDISALSGLTNLTRLNLWHNSISDISALSGLTNLRELTLGNNSVSDISAVSDLTKLRLLNLDNNSVSDISLVSGLTNLRELTLGNNSVSDISAVSGLTNLTRMNLRRNSISDISPIVENTGLAGEDKIDLWENRLDYPSIHTHIPILQKRGVTITFDNRVPTTLLNLSGVITASDNILTVEVRDGKGDVFEGVPVTFTVASGGGTLSVESTATDKKGRAQSRLTLGSDGEANRVKVSAVGVEQTATFSDVPEAGIRIPDPNLRAAIEDALGVTSRRPISSEEMATLTDLTARNASIGVLIGLEFATNLTELRLGNNGITDISPLSGLTNLRTLGLGRNSVTDISPLSGLTNLRTLGLSSNGIKDVSALVSVLSSLTNLRELHLWNNQITDVASLSGLTNLTRLRLGSNSITDIVPLSGLTHLTSLDLSNNNIEDVSVLIPVLSDLTDLRDLNLSDNNITYLSPLAVLTNLTSLNLRKNNISDISPLVENTGLGAQSWVDVGRNPLSYQSLYTHIPTLESRGVTVDFDNQAHPALLKISGDNQKRLPGETLTNPFIVEAQDENGFPLAGVWVTFTVIEGGGTLSIQTTPTSANGRAESTLTLGSNPPGTNTVEVSVEGIAQIVVFSAEAVFPPSVPTTLSIVSGDDQSGLTGEALVNPFVVEVRGQYDDPIEGVAVTFAVGAGGGTPSPEMTTTDANGRAESTLTLGSNPGTNTVEVSVEGIAQTVAFSAEAALPPPVPTTLSIVSGDNQSGLTGEALANPFVVEVRDQYDDPMEGITMTFAVSAGSGALSVTTAMTDANGQAESTLTLGTDPGTNTVEVSVGGISQTVVFNAEAALPPPMPTTLSIVSGDSQSGLTGEALTNPFVAEVRDQYDDPMEGITVTFAVSAGGGAPSPEITTTDANGRAESTLTLGSNPGTNTVEVSVEGISQTVVFSAEAALPPPVPTTLSIVSGDNQSGLTGEVLANPFVVEVRDQYDDPMEGITVTFAVSAGSGALSVITAMTDANGQAESTLTLGTDPGTNTVEVSVGGISQTVVFNAEAALPPPMPTTLSIVSGDSQSGLTGEVLANPFVVEVRDQYDDPMEGVTVTFAVSAGGGAPSPEMITTDANGRAESTLTLGPNPGTNTVTVSVERITEMLTFNALAKLLEFDLSVPTGISLIHVPLKVATVGGVAKTITSIADLYDALGGADTVNFLVTLDSQAQKWHSYFGTSSTGTPADKELTVDMGIIASMKTPASIRLTGNPLGTDGSSTVILNQGLNLVGLPLRDERINRVSDLLRLDGIWGNVSVITLSDGGKLKAVGRADDPGDIEITGGQAFILNARQTATVSVSGDGWTNVSVTAAAPPMLTGIQVGNTTPVLVLSGSIVDEETGVNKISLRVKVKNLSTNGMVTIMTGAEETGYRLTVVDIETARAARIGDILEISAQSPDPFIGVQPFQYTVTAEDVKRSLIQLPALVAYEIPAETELLANYPNPFNPETWIPYRLAEDAFVTLTIYDGNGQVIRTLDVGHRIASAYENRSKAIYWDGRNGFGERVASGVYFYHLSAGDYSATRKMLVLK